MPSSSISQPLIHESFPSFVLEYPFVVVHFWASWNGVDQQMKKLLETQIPADLRSRVTFASFDIDPPAHHDLCRQHAIINIPFLAFYRAGSLIRTVAGMQTPEAIAEYLRELVDNTV